MSRACKICKGRGVWEENIQENSAEYSSLWYECSDCKGTGLAQDPESGADYDIGGDSYAEDD